MRGVKMRVLSTTFLGSAAFAYIMQLRSRLSANFCTSGKYPCLLFVTTLGVLITAYNKASFFTMIR
jgi:hypothetical protein